MSLDLQIKRLTSQTPPISNPDFFAQQCAEELRKHRKSDTIFGVVIGILMLAALLVGTKDTVQSAGWLLPLSAGYLVRRMLARDRLRELLTTQHPDAAMKAGVKAGAQAANDVPRYARKK